MKGIVRVTEAVRITEYADGTSTQGQTSVQPAAAALPRGYDPAIDSPLAGRTNPPIHWTGPVSSTDREQIRTTILRQKQRAERRRIVWAVALMLLALVALSTVSVFASVGWAL